MQKRQHARWPWLAAFASLAIVLTGAIAAGASAGKSAQGACATIAKYQLQKQTNSHAAAVLAACGRTPASQSQLNSNFSSLAHLSRTPQDYGGTDVNLITGGEGSFPHTVQSETQVWAQGNTVVSAYNDSRTAPGCYSGGSYSTNGGSTWTNLNTRPFCAGHGTGFGDPVVVYEVMHSKWIAVFLASGCGGQGLGVWTSNDGITWPQARVPTVVVVMTASLAGPTITRQAVPWPRISVSNNFAVGGGAPRSSGRTTRNDLDCAGRRRQLCP